MKKFMLLYIGAVEPTPEVMKTWESWFGVLGNRVVDSGNPFGPGKEVRRNGSEELAMDEHAISGYTIISAENIEEVEELVAKDCPMITSVKILETLPM